MAILAGLEGFNDDGVGFAMVSDHEVLVAAVGSEWEAACVVGEYNAGGIDPEVDIFGSFRREGFIKGGRWRVKLILACLDGAGALL